MIRNPWLSALILTSYVPAFLLSPADTPWLLWMLPMALTLSVPWRAPMPSAPPTAPGGGHSATMPGQAAMEVHWQRAVDALPEGVVLLDAQLRLRWFNPEAQHLLGLYGKRDLGNPLRYCMNQPLLDDHLERGDLSLPIDLPSPVDGSRMLNLRFIPLEGEGSWLLHIRDITRPYEMDRRQEDFLANISHELKTPLTVFKGMLELLPMLTPGSPPWRDALELLQKQSGRMQNLIEEQSTLLRLGNAHVFSTTPIEMDAFLKDMVEDANAISGKKQHTFLLSVDETCLLDASPELLRCMVGNLLCNAVHHTPAQTEVRIIWERDTQGHPQLIVADNGPGIASYHLPRLTEKYYRVTFQHAPSSTDEESRTGSGLGLALVKQAMERCRGEFEIASRPGIGSRFILRFPEHMLMPAESDDTFDSQPPNPIKEK
ncbi:MAG: PAS domain-containing protein [Magnetococcales bacterium]|nr:PAS domain-containing protein [Magnetococcales bacterium]